MYAFMQAMGLVNDHAEGCHMREAALGRPQEVHSDLSEPFLSRASAASAHGIVATRPLLVTRRAPGQS